jgi:hypothetical protein
MFREHWMGISRTAVAAAVAVIVAAPALAQNTTAGIAGRVTGADGKPLAGASVTIVHLESRSTNTVATDAEGRYNARGLRPGGPYTITITKDGLVDKREGVFLSLAETAALDASWVFRRRRCSSPAAPMPPPSTAEPWAQPPPSARANWPPLLPSSATCRTTPAPTPA